MSPSQKSPARQAVIAVIAILVVIFALPQSLRQSLPGVLGSADFKLGLDLAGGTQLDFRISESEIEAQKANLNKEIAQAQKDNKENDVRTLQLELQILDQQRQNLVEAIRQVLERRINSLGVSEATITPSYVGDEKHLLVECPGVVDVQKCIATVGKTIQLEFKEEQKDASKDYIAQVRAKADVAQQKLTSKQSTLEKLGQDMGSELGVGYQPGQWFMKSTLPKGLESLWQGPLNQVRRFEGAIVQQTTGQNGAPTEVQVPGIFLAELLEPKTQTGRVISEASVAFGILSKEGPGMTAATKQNVDVSTLPAEVQAALKDMQPGALKSVSLKDGSAQLLFLRNITPGQEEMEASHILVAYKGASGAAPTVTRTREQAKAQAEALKKQIDGGADFTTLATKESDAESKKSGGKLGMITKNTLVGPFADAAFALPKGGISGVVETAFGFHIIRSDRAPFTSADQASYDVLTVTGADAASKATAMVTRLQNGEVKQNEDAIKVRFLFFSLQPVGWKDTALDGKHFRSASVTTDTTTNLPIVQIIFDSEGGKLFQQLTKANIGKRIAIFVGGEMVSSPTVQAEISGGTAVITGSQTFAEAQQLAQDLNTGAIPAPIYLSGQHTVEPTLGAESLRTSLHAGVVGAIVLMLFLIVVYRLLGVLGSMSLLAYALIFLALLKLPLFLITGQYIVLTLAGIAGMILSIGLAVDANVLIFERIKEELRKGRGLKQAVELGFERAWPSIRDSNISTLITCAILFIIGTSIVRGFAVTLSMGVLISLFTGLVLTRFFARMVARSPLAERMELFLWKKPPQA